MKNILIIDYVMTSDFDAWHQDLLQQLHQKQLPCHPLDYVLDTYDFGDKPALEFGVYSGVSIRRIRQAVKGPVYGFDSFEGLPEQWRENYPPGAFAVSTPQDVPNVPNVTLIKGWFDQVLPGFMQNILKDTPVGLLHIDCDLYSSTKTVLDALDRNIQAGTVLVFDEFLNYPGYEKHELLAFWEWYQNKDLLYELIGGCGSPTSYKDTQVEQYNNQQVAMRILKNE